MTVTAGATEPRYPSLKGIMAAKSKPVERLSAADLGIGDLGATQSVVAVSDAPPKAGGESCRATTPWRGSRTCSRKRR